ncbi:MAG: hypothetical protein KDD66_16285 [Bdellovibrionales bacterium]|nr:hypothetical protein [Bdellovibrionales bacterium]
MTEQEVTELRECTLTKRTAFHYFKDRYALELLRYRVGDGMDIRSIKRSAFAQLLQKEIIKDIAAKSGGADLRPEQLHVWPSHYQSYYLSHGRYGNKSKWGYGYYQTTRRGFNLALHLNFSSQHDDAYQQLINPGQGEHPFLSLRHPHSALRNTLAWARLDIDLKNSEALIEEIQTDWLRYARWTRAYLHRTKPKNPRGKTIAEKFPSRGFSRGLNCCLSQLDRYVDFALGPYQKTWDEAMMLATIWYLREEVGISRIFYHTFEAGCRVKRIEGRLPPRSIYSRLPKRFCFEETSVGPACVTNYPEGYMKHVLRAGLARWYLLKL